MRILGNIKKCNEDLTVLFLVLIYFSEGYAKVYFSSFDERTLSAIIVKSILCSLVFIGLFRDKKTLSTIMFIVFGFCVGQYFLDPNFNTKVVISAIKYSYFVAVLSLYQLLFKNTTNNKLLKWFMIIVALNSVLIILGTLFNLSIFRSYPELRFGYNGLLMSTATSTYFYFAALTVLIVTYRENVIFKRITYLVMVACLLVGTKSLLFALGCFFLVYTFSFLKKKLRIYAIIILVFLSILTFYRWFFVNDLFNSIRKNFSLLSSVLSKRDQLLFESTIPFISSEWAGVNYLFGGINNISSRPQLALVDLLYFFGIVGTTVYLFKIVKIFRVTVNSLLGVSIILALGFIVFISGNFFSNASAVTYAVIMWECLKKDFVGFNKYH